MLLTLLTGVCLVRRQRLHFLFCAGGSHMTFRTDAGSADAAAYCAREPPIFHVQILLVASLSAVRYEFVSTLLRFLGTTVAFCVPTKTVYSVGLEHFRWDYELLEYCFDLIFKALLLTFSLQLTSGEFTVENLSRESMVIHSYHVFNPSELPPSELAFVARRTCFYVKLFMHQLIFPCHTQNESSGLGFSSFR